MRFGVVFLVACGSSPALPDAFATDGTPAKAVDCAATFGAELTAGFGRLDGTLLAVIPPGYQGCAQPNSTHAVVQVMVDGAAYRMVVNVLSTSNEPRVYLGEIDAALAGGAWAEGWHLGYPLDYVTTLGVTRSQFTLADEATAAARVYDHLELGQHVSVFATSGGPPQADSAHLIHRNATNADGAIVLQPETAPHYLLTAFDDTDF
jgi:hypothetical protein